MERIDFCKGIKLAEADQLVFTFDQIRRIIEKLAGKEVDDVSLVGKLLAEKFKISDIKIIVRKAEKLVFLVFSNRNHFLTIKNGLDGMDGHFRRVD